MKIGVTIAVVVMLAALEAVALAGPIAEDLYADGEIAFKHDDYPTAIAKWSESYRLSGESSILFDIAQAQRLSGDCTRAIETYRRFAAADPTAEQRPLAEDLARELEGKCGAPKPIVAKPKPIVAKPIATPPSEVEKIAKEWDPVGELKLVDRLSHPNNRERPGRMLKIAGLATGGAGTLVLAIGLGLGHHGQALGDEVTSACRAGCNWAAQAGKDAAGRRDVAIGRALDVIGAGAIAGGAVLYYLGYREATVVVAPSSREGAVVTWSGSW